MLVQEFYLCFQQEGNWFLQAGKITCISTELLYQKTFQLCTRWSKQVGKIVLAAVQFARCPALTRPLPVTSHRDHKIFSFVKWFCMDVTLRFRLKTFPTQQNLSFLTPLHYNQSLVTERLEVINLYLELQYHGYYLF